jgi:DNA-binding transcriptional MocR family regulator
VSSLQHGCLPRPAIERFSQIPDGLHQLVASPREFQLVALLLSYRWTADAVIYPSVRTLAERLNCSERTVQRTCAALEARGLLVREYRHREDEGQTSNRYHLAGALLALVSVVVDTRTRSDRRPPVTRWSVERNSGKHYTRKTGRERYAPIPTAASAYLQTSRGTLKRR